VVNYNLYGSNFKKNVGIWKLFYYFFLDMKYIIICRTNHFNSDLRTYTSIVLQIYSTNNTAASWKYYISFKCSQTYRANNEHNIIRLN